MCVLSFLGGALKEVLCLFRTLLETSSAYKIRMQQTEHWYAHVQRIKQQRFVDVSLALWPRIKQQRSVDAEFGCMYSLCQ